MDVFVLGLLSFGIRLFVFRGGLFFLCFVVYLFFYSGIVNKEDDWLV